MRAAMLLCCLLAFVQQVTAQTTYNERGLVGGEVILPCDYDQANDGTIITVVWVVSMGGSSTNLYIRTGGSTDNLATPPAEYVGRVELVDDVNLKLTRVTIEDETQYSCTVTASVNSEASNTNLQVFKQPSAPVVQVQYEPPTSTMSEVPLNTTVTYTCTSTGGRPPATLGWSVTENGTVVSVNPTYTSSNNSQGVGDATSTFILTTAKHGVTYRVQCTASGPDPILTRTSAVTSFTTEPDPSATPTTPKGQTGGGGLDGGAIAGIIIGVILAIVLVAALVYIFVIRKKPAGEEDGDARDVSDGQYENVAHPNQRIAAQRPGSGSDDYDYEMPIPVHPPPQPPQSSGDYQELRPAIYQSLQKH